MAGRGGGGIITPVDSTKVIRGVELKSIGSIPTSELLNLTDNSANTVLSIVGNTATGSCDLAVNKHKALTISVTGTTNGLSVDSNQILTLSAATTSANGAMLAPDKVKLNSIGTVYSYTFSGYEYPQTPNQWYSAGGITLPPGVYLCFGQLYTNASNTLMQISIQSSANFADNGGAWQQFGNCQSATICVPYSLQSTTTLYLLGNHSNASLYYGFNYSIFNITRIG